MRDYKKHIWKALTVLGVFLLVGIPETRAFWPVFFLISGAGGLLDYFFVGERGETFLGDLLGNIGADVIAALAFLINGIITVLGNLFFWVANTTIDWAMKFNSVISDSPVVKEGFSISLSVANIGILVGFIVMAIAIMIRAEWLVEVKKTIPKFITAVLLINFGFFILTVLLINPVNGVFQNVYLAANLNMDTFSGALSPHLDIESVAAAQMRLSKIPSGEREFADKFLNYLRFKEEVLGPGIDDLLKQYELDPGHFPGLPVIGREIYTDTDGNKIEFSAFVSPEQRAGVKEGILATVNLFLEDMDDGAHNNNKEQFKKGGWGAYILPIDQIDPYFSVRGAPYKACLPSCETDFEQLKEDIANFINGALGRGYSNVPLLDGPGNDDWGFDCLLWDANGSPVYDEPNCYDGRNGDGGNEYNMSVSNMAERASKGLGDMEKIVISVIEVIFNFTFTFLGAFTLLGVALMLIYRYVALSLLIILFPFVWLGWIFPKIATAGGGKNIWNAWWGQFIRWLLFGPIAMFFIYLSAKAAVNIDALSSVPGETFVGKGSMAVIAASVGNAAVVIGLLMGGTHVANKMGIAGSGMIMGAIKSSGKWLGKAALKYTGRGVGRGVGSTLRAKGVQNALDKVQNSDFLQNKIAGRLMGGRFIAGTAGRVRSRGTRSARESIAEHEKKQAKYSISELESIYPTLTKFGQMAAQKRFIDEAKGNNRRGLARDHYGDWMKSPKPMPAGLTEEEQRNWSETIDRDTVMGRHGLEDTVKKGRKEGLSGEQSEMMVELEKLFEEKAAGKDVESTINAAAAKLQSSIEASLRGVTDTQAAMWIKQFGGLSKSFKVNPNQRTAGVNNEGAHIELGRIFRDAMIEAKPTALPRAKTFMDAKIREHYAEGLNELSANIQREIHNTLSGLRLPALGPGATTEEREQRNDFDRTVISSTKGVPGSKASRQTLIASMKQARSTAQAAGALTDEQLKALNERIAKLGGLFEGGSGIDDNIPFAAS